MIILVTGANGQLGNEMRRISAAQEKDEYVFTDVAELDICDAEAVERMLSERQIDVIVNCAAYTNVNGAESNQEICDKINREAPGILAEAASRHHCRFLHISTDYVFDGNHYLPYREDDVPCPTSVYGSTKLAGEQLVQAQCPEAVIIRTAWLYSSFGNNFVKTMLRLGRERDSLGVVFDQIGSPTYARDLAAAVDTILHSKEWIPGIYHFTDEGVCSWYDFTLAIHRLAGIDCVVNAIHTSDYPTPVRRPPYSVLDKSKIKETYGVVVPYWLDSLKECINQIEQSNE
ncbi:MAG: dTDP-4-dehydrorhamnose reductase [Bacteroidaceae bacterium]|nr:dTDP-4-dehydrorhamnose reductase [Bacteroidaceae bacterium]